MHTFGRTLTRTDIATDAQIDIHRHRHRHKPTHACRNTFEPKGGLDDAVEVFADRIDAHA